MSSGLRRLAAVAGALGAFLAVALPAAADPPGRVGRLSEMSGTVSFHDADDDQWSPAALNAPVTSGNAFWTEPGARTEIRIGTTAMHMDGATELDIATLDDHQLVASLPQGTLNLRILHLIDGDSYSVATPRGIVTILSPGTYHIDAGTDQDPTNVAVFEGAARIDGPSSSLSLRRGEAALVTGADTVSFEIVEAQPTPFDNAVLTQERREEMPRPAMRYVSQEMTGIEDLDDHGSWRSDPGYGAVWYPQAVPADWAPYHDGHWRWVEPWGWTWIDDQPWGFAPFHYGRWAFIENRWGWVPGSVVVRPVYAPALVTFVGGAGWSASLSIGREPCVGWFPLAPREVFVPSYRTSVTYVRNVNVTNVTNVTNITQQTINNVRVVNNTHANQRFATVVPQTDFVAARPVAKAAVTVPATAIAAAPVARDVPITPEAAAHTGRPAAIAAARHVAELQAGDQQDRRPGSGRPGARDAIANPAPIKPTVPASPGPPIAAPKPAATAARTPGDGRPDQRRPNQPPPTQGQTPAAPAPGSAPAQAGKPPAVASPGPPIAAPSPAATAARTPGDGRPDQRRPNQPPPTQGQPPAAPAPGSAPAQAGRPPAVASPGPPIRPAPSTDTSRAAPQQGAPIASPSPRPPAQPGAAPPAQASVPPSAAPGPAIRRGPDAAPRATPANPASPSPAAAAPPATRTAPEQHVATPTPPAPRPVQAPAPPRVPQATANAAPTAAPPSARPTIAPEHAAPRPLQQTVLQPTREGWTRAPAPPPAPAPARAAPQRPAPAAAAPPRPAPAAVAPPHPAPAAAPAPRPTAAPPPQPRPAAAPNAAAPPPDPKKPDPKKKDEGKS